MDLKAVTQGFIDRYIQTKSTITMLGSICVCFAFARGGKEYCTLLTFDLWLGFGRIVMFLKISTLETVVTKGWQMKYK